MLGSFFSSKSDCVCFMAVAGQEFLGDEERLLCIAFFQLDLPEVFLCKANRPVKVPKGGGFDDCNGFLAQTVLHHLDP